MRSSNWTPSIVPPVETETVYLVLDDFGKLGQAFRETDYERSDLESTITDLITGQYANPVSVVAFNLEERWADDVSRDIALEIRRRSDLAYEDVPSPVVDFVERHAGWERQLALRLA
jgi:hypothetical protein